MEAREKSLRLATLWQSAGLRHPSVSIAVLLGAIAAVGGGVVRDVLLAQIPVVLRVDIYAAAALRPPSYWRATHHRRHLGGALCFTLRMLAVGAELAAAE